jgi:SAM-dependent methyltransferase
MVAGDAEWYAASGYYRYRRLWLPAVDPRSALSWPIPWNFKEALSVLRTLPLASKPKLLDVGCGEGQFLYRARQIGLDVSGVDLNPAGLEAAKRIFGIASLYQGSLEDLSASPSRELYDAITMLEVLEHTADPLGTIRTAARLLKPGGLLLVSVPGNRRWPPLFDPETDSPPHHLTLWTEPSLARILERGGLEVLSVRRKGLDSGELGCFAKLRLRGPLEGILSFLNFGSPNKQRPAPENSPASKQKSLGLVRLCAWIALTPLGWALRLNPRAGGFTLFARCRKPS